MINYVSKSFRKKLSEFSLRSFFLLHTTLNSAESVPLSGEGFFRTLNSVSYCKRRILKVKNNIRCFFKCSKFSTTSVFWKKNWQRLFEKAIKKKRGNLNYKTHPVVLFSSVSVTKKENEQNKDNALRQLTSSNDPVSKVKVWILTQI